MKVRLSYVLLVAMAGVSFLIGTLFGGKGSSAQAQLQQSEVQLQRPGDSLEQQTQMPPAKSGLGVIGNMAFVVRRVEPDSPAAQLGLQRGDLITEWNGRQVISIRDFLAMSQLEPGQPIEIEFARANFAKGKYEVLTGKTVLAPAKF